jgi:cobalt-zinc-cadmium efflux system membrane fusion protein
VKRRARLLVVLVMVLAIAAVAALMLRRGTPPPQEASAPAEAPSETGTVKFLMEQQWAIRMKLAKATPATVARQIVAAGRVVPAAGHQAVVASAVAGTITGNTLPRVGQTIARGQTVAVLHHTPTPAEAAQIAASRAQAQIEGGRLDADRRRLTESVKEAEVRRDQAQRELERARQLYEQKAYARRQVEAAEAEYRASETQLASAIAQRDSLQNIRVAPPGSASINHVVTAPVGGTVVRVAKAVGEPVAPGEAIVEIVDPTTVWIEVLVAERDLARVGRQVRASFRVPGTEGEFSSRLIDAGAVISRETRMGTLVFEVPNGERRLRIGAQVEARLDAAETVAGLMVPREAVLEAEGKRFVYVLLSGEEFQRREVAVADEYGDRVAIVSGLKAGERVVTQGIWQLRQQELRPGGGPAHTHE